MCDEVIKDVNSILSQRIGVAQIGAAENECPTWTLPDFGCWFQCGPATNWRLILGVSAPSDPVAPHSGLSGYE